MSPCSAHTYDALRRPVDRSISVNGGAEKLLSRIVYGEQLANPEATNHRGRVHRIYDGGGAATTLAFDFEGQALGEGSTVRYAYDEGGQLQRVTLNHRGSATTQTLVDDIRYDAKGRRRT